MQIVGFLDRFIANDEKAPSFRKQLRNVLGFSPGNTSLYKAALTHRSVKEMADENNERLEYLGDAILSGIVADFLFKTGYQNITVLDISKISIQRAKKRLGKIVIGFNGSCGT